MNEDENVRFCECLCFHGQKRNKKRDVQITAGHVSVLSQDKMLKRRGECIVGGQRKD